MRVRADPNVITFAYVSPSSDPPDSGFACAPDYDF